MGLFSKESWIVCGGKVNALTKAKTAEGSVCSSCLSLCSPNFVSNIKNKNVSEIKMHIAEGEKILLIAPGNYGQDFLLNTLGIELKRSIKCSNYIGDTIDMVCDAGAEAMLLVGHIGKLVKLGAGIMNTHSKAADGRMEVLAACAIRAGAEADTARKILDCVTTEAALDILKKSDRLENTMKQLMIRIEDVLQRRSSGKIRIGAIVFSNEYGILGKTKTADKLLEDIINNGE